VDVTAADVAAGVGLLALPAGLAAGGGGRALPVLPPLPPQAVATPSAATPSVVSRPVRSSVRMGTSCPLARRSTRYRVLRVEHPGQPPVGDCIRPDRAVDPGTTSSTAALLGAVDQHDRGADSGHHQHDDPEPLPRGTAGTTARMEGLGDRETPVSTLGSVSPALIVAIVGLALAAASLAWQTATFVLTGSRVQCELHIGAIGQQHFFVHQPVGRNEVVGA